MNRSFSFFYRILFSLFFFTTIEVRANNPSNIDDFASSCRYTFISEIGKGTFSTVFLAVNEQGEFFAVKEYEINDPECLAVFMDKGISPELYVKRLALHEWKIGRLMDHPHIVTIEDIWFANSKAYVAMQYLNGTAFDSSENVSREKRIIFLNQFFSAIEYLLEKSVIPDDLWSGNILITDDAGLFLIDLGGYEIIGENAYMPLKHYLKQITYMAKEIGRGDATLAFTRTEHLIPPEIRKEPISSTHIEIIQGWLQALRNEIDLTTAC